MSYWQCPGCGTVVPDDVTWGPGKTPCHCPPDAGFRVRRRSYKTHIAGTVASVQVAEWQGHRDFLAFVSWDDGTGSRVNMRALKVIPLSGADPATVDPPR